MLNTKNSGSNSVFSEWLKLRPWVSLGLLLILVLAPAGISCAAQAQSSSSGIQAYADAIKQSTISERITAMDRYVATSGSSRLKTDALEFLVWDNLRLGHQSQSERRAKELIAISPGNPIAVAVLNQDMSSAPRDKATAANRLAQLNSAMTSIDQLSKPEGMLDRNFQTLKQQVAIMLNGAVGLSYLAIEDYPRARMALEQAVASDPNNVQWVYGMGLALLNGKNRDQYRGYWYLARAANLTAGTPQGQEINNYAWRGYVKDGGKAEGWQRYQASAAALDAPPNPDTGKPRPAANSVVASNRTNTRSTGNFSTATNSPSPAKRTEKGTETTEASNRGKSSGKKRAPFGFEDTLHEPPSREPVASASVPANRPKVIAAPSEAVSLGILIETSLLTSQNRQAIIATLRDIVRNLRVNDEAAILVFSDQLDFEQDLTADDALLEEALGQIRPKQGKALLSGVAFAAGHLKRIGKNGNRVLLVISDGRSGQTTSDSLTFRSQVSGVRIDCIGLNAGGSERALLEQVAAYSGGKASFASDSGEFRTAALQMTRNMGIAVP